MQVKDAYESHRDLWKALPNSVRTAKTARVHRLGDVYEPRSGDDPFDPGTYYPPVEKHSHASERWPDEWREDIKYLGKKTRRHTALLVGDPDRSYLWNSPMFIYSGVLHRGQKKFENLGAFLAELKPCR